MADNIVQYTSPTDKIQPSDEGANALAHAGRSEGALYREAGAQYKDIGDRTGKIIENHEAMTEISQGSAALAAMHNNFTTQWNQMASKTDPNDASIQGKFLDDTVEPQLQQFQNGFQTERGQNWAMNASDQMRSHYYDKTSADMSQRAGTAVVQNMKVILDNLSSAARKDPSSMDASLGQVDALIAATKEHNQGTLTPEQIDKMENISRDMKNEIVKSGIQGLADVNPKAAIDAINTKKFDNYMTGTEGDQLMKYAEGVTRMKLEDQNLAYIQKERAQKQADENFSNAVLDKIQPDPNTGAINIPSGLMQQVFSQNGVSGEAKLKTMSAISHIAKETSIDDPQTVRDLYAGIGSGSVTQQSVLTALAQGKITAQTYNEVNGILKGTATGEIATKNFAQNMKAIEEMVKGKNPLMPGLQDPKGDEQLAKALPAVSKALQDGLAKGIPESELQDPSSKNWIGNAAKPFVRPTSEWTSDIVGAALSASKGNLDAKTAQEFESGKLKGPEGLKELQARVRAGTVTRAQANTLAIKYGYAKAAGEKSSASVPRPED